MSQQDPKIQSLNLIRIENDKIVLNQQAALNFTKYNGPLSIVSACGQYRTGKSLLLNLLFYKDCFDVSPTIKPCTKGINMISSPFHIKGKNIWVFDTEGFGSMQQDGKYDAKIFLLSILLSELVIYNSVGSLDQTSLQKIALMCKRAEMLTKPQYIKQSQQQNCMLNKDTKFYWVIRDFALSLTNKNGKYINADQYLQEALNLNIQKNQFQRKIIKRIFKHRRCFPLVRPCISQTNLQSLKDIPTTSLRSQFQEVVRNIKEKIAQQIPYKMLFGQYLTGFQFVELLKYYIKMINDMNFESSLTVTWKQIQEHQKQVILINVQQQICKKIQHYKKLTPINQDDFNKLNQQLRQIYNKFIVKIGIDYLITYKDQIQKLQKCKLDKLKEYNNQIIMEKCHTYIQDSLHQIFNKFQNFSNYDKFNSLLEENLEILKKNYDLRFQNLEQNVVNLQYSKMLSKIVNWLLKKIIAKLISDFEEINIVEQQKSKFIEDLKSQIKLHIFNEQDKEKQMEQLQKMYKSSLVSINSYIQVIARMQKVNQTLRSQFQHLQQSSNQQKIMNLKTLSGYEYKLQVKQKAAQLFKNNYEQAQQLSKKYQQQIRKLKEQYHQIKETYFYSNKQVRQKFENTIILQRGQFQRILQEKNKQIIIIQQQIKDKESYWSRTKEQINSQLNHTKLEYQQCLKLIKLRHLTQLSQLNETIRSMNIDIEKLRDQLGLKDRQIQMKEKNCIQISQKKQNELRELINRQNELNKQLKHIEAQNNQLMNLYQQQKLKMNISREELSATRLKAKLDIQTMTHKLNESLKMHTASSQKRFNVTKLQLEIEKQKIVSKLVEAAQRIEQMTEKQKQQSYKISQVQTKLQTLKCQLQSQKLKQCRICPENLTKILQMEENYEKSLQSNSQLKKIIQIQISKLEKIKANHKKCKFQTQSSIWDRRSFNQNSGSKAKQNQGRKQHILQQIESPGWDDLNIQRLKFTIQKYSNQNKILRAQVKSLKGQLNNWLKLEKQSTQNNRTKIKNPTNQRTQQLKIIELEQENKNLKNQFQLIRKKSDKWHSETLKNINLHSTLKKLKQTDIKSEQKLQIQSTLNMEIKSNQNPSQKYIEQLLQQLKQLNQLIYLQNQQINYLQSTIRQKQESFKEKQRQTKVKRMKLEQKAAFYEIQMQRSSLIIKQMNKKIEYLADQVNKWKTKALKTQIIEQTQQRSTLYKQKIKELFNNL